MSEITTAGEFQELDTTLSGGVTAVQIPYWNGSASDSQPGRLAAMVVMPTSESLGTWLQGLDPTTWQALVGRLRPTAVRLTMPAFSLSSSTDLNSALEALGIRTAFSPSADFSGLSPDGLTLSLVKQDATLRVDRFGTVASAATASVISPTAVFAATPITIDHPFLFVVRDTVTGTVLFAATVEQP